MISATKVARNLDRPGIWFASSVIVCVLGLQFAAVVLRPAEHGWPFTDYPMFATPRYEGARITAEYFVYASLSDGREIQLSAEDIDIPKWLFRKWAAHIVRPNPGPKLDGMRAQVKKFFNLRPRDWDAISKAILDRYRVLIDAQLVQLRIEDTPKIVTRAGVGNAERTVLATVVLTSGDVAIPSPLSPSSKDGQ